MRTAAEIVIIVVGVLAIVWLWRDLGLLSVAIGGN